MGPLSGLRKICECVIVSHKLSPTNKNPLMIRVSIILVQSSMQMSEKQKNKTFLS